VSGLDSAAVLLRLVIGVTMFAHGYRHAFGGGKLAGTAQWFESIGIRPGRVHAPFATLTEVGAGVLLVFGFLTPLAAAGVVGTMGVALVANHLRRGFFIFNPGEGYEYVLNLVVAALALSALGGGAWSIDALVGLDHWRGWGGLATGACVGIGGAAMLLATSWRPSSVKTTD
jgi:putative oxidoreductase